MISSSNDALDVEHSTSVTDQSSSQLHIPIVRSVDKASSSLPQNISMTEDFFRACVGFRRVDTLKKNISALYQSTIRLDQTLADAVFDSGSLATVKKKDRNTKPVPRSTKFADVVHLDIVFGPEVSVGNVHYGLICVDPNDLYLSLT